MDIEFHYYMTFLIAAKAGFGQDEAYTIAYSSQYVDDNDMIFKINKDKAQYYKKLHQSNHEHSQTKIETLSDLSVISFYPGGSTFPRSTSQRWQPELAEHHT